MSKGLELPWSRRCGRIELPGSRFSGWEIDLGSRHCGWEIDLGADVAAGRLIWEPIQQLRDWFWEPISTVLKGIFQLFFK